MKRFFGKYYTRFLAGENKWVRRCSYVSMFSGIGIVVGFILFVITNSQEDSWLAVFMYLCIALAVIFAPLVIILKVFQEFSRFLSRFVPEKQFRIRLKIT